MLAIFISWIVIGFILLSFGDMLLMLYERVCKQTTTPNLIDKILIGLCFLIIPLSIWSLWLPSNHIFLSGCIILSSAYWLIYRKRAVNICRLTKHSVASRTGRQSLLLAIFILSSLYFFAWEQEVYDSLIYHHQNIRWNEEYAVVPGLGNLDDKFGFNSNYFLLSAIFTFRFLFGDGVYPLQSFFVTIISCWIFFELFKSDYEIKRILILLSFALLFWVSIYFLGNTSTDILPNFIVFYIIARLVLHPKLLKNNNIVYIVLPVFLLTCKLSFFPICIISFYLLYALIKEKKYKEVTILCSICALIVIPWLIRNVIISGYLVYPLYQIDLFSFDWKVPQEVALKQKDYIFAIGYYFFRIALRYPETSIRDPFYINILTDVIYLLTFISMMIITYYIIKQRKKVKEHIWLLYFVFLLSILVWITGGPDIRFIVGILCSVIFCGGILLFRNKHLRLTAKIISFLFVIGIFTWNSSRIYDFYTQTYHSNLFSSIAYKPYSVIDQRKAQDIDVEKDFTIHPLNKDVSILLNTDLSYDIFPSTIHSHYAKFISIDCLEARGRTLQEGFKVKDACK